MEVSVIQSSDYNVFVGNDALAALQVYIDDNYKDATKIIIADENTLAHCLPIIEATFDVFNGVEVIEIESGEQNKNIEVCVGIWRSMMASRLDRKSLVINLGGGVIGDMGGFIASTYKRGIDFINIPTTLLAQVDASVGGKLGIDLDAGKNQIGVFNNPKAVFVFPGFLNSLDGRNLISGFAEVIKHALIQDKEKWNALLQFNFSDGEQLNDVIEDSILIKNRIVLADPTEQNIRKLLNFGHTIGHAVESYSLLHAEDPLLHGEAIAVGMICEAYISMVTTGFPQQDLELVFRFIAGLYPLHSIDTGTYHSLLELMANDKKNSNGLINFTLLNNIGEGSIDHTCSAEVIIESLEFYNGCLAAANA